MVTLHEGKQFIINNDHIASAEEAAKLSEEAAKKETLTWQVLSKHNHSDNMEHLEIQFDSMGVYDNTYVGILQTAYASGLKEFPMPCVFTNCHNCLCRRYHQHRCPQICRICLPQIRWYLRSAA